jgi:N-acylneuraminate cytidylyltransferase
MQMLMATESLENVVPVLRFGHPIQRALKIEDGRLCMIAPECLNERSQDLTPAYRDAGQWYWLRTAPFLCTRRLFSTACAPVVLDEMEAQDIDNECDWTLAELKFAKQNLIRKESPNVQN